jgi:hypothetical protein
MATIEVLREERGRPRYGRYRVLVDGHDLPPRQLLIDRPPSGILE